MAYDIYPVDVVWLECLREITLHFIENAGICGISTRADGGAYTFGLKYGNATSLSLKHPGEFVTQINVYRFGRIDLEVSSYMPGFIVVNQVALIPLSQQLKTNLGNRVCSSSVPEAAARYSFASSAGKCLKGFYFQRNVLLSSIGPIFGNIETQSSDGT